MSRWTIYLFVYFFPALAIAEAGILIGVLTMNQIIIIGVILLGLAGIATFFIMKLRKGAKLEVENKVLTKTANVQKEQLKAAVDGPTGKRSTVERLNRGGKL